MTPEPSMRPETSRFQAEQVSERKVGFFDMHVLNPSLRVPQREYQHFDEISLSFPTFNPELKKQNVEVPRNWGWASREANAAVVSSETANRYEFARHVLMLKGFGDFLPQYSTILRLDSQRCVIFNEALDNDPALKESAREYVRAFMGALNPPEGLGKKKNLEYIIRQIMRLPYSKLREACIWMLEQTEKGYLSTSAKPDHPRAGFLSDNDPIFEYDTALLFSLLETRKIYFDAEKLGLVIYETGDELWPIEKRIVINLADEHMLDSLEWPHTLTSYEREGFMTRFEEFEGFGTYSSDLKPEDLD